MKNYLSLSFLLIPLCFFRCSPKVVHFTNPNSQFALYEKFGVVNYKHSEELSTQGTEVYLAVESAVNYELVRRGYIKDNKNPDIVLRYELISNQKSNVSSSNTTPYSAGRYPYPSYPRYTVNTIEQSIILLELFDVATSKLVWQSSLELDKTSKRNPKEQIIKEAISKLFNTYLYRAKSNTTDQSLITE